MNHGIAQLTDGGTIKVAADVRDDWLLLEVNNPTPDVVADSQGQRLALENIRQRLVLRYGEAAQLTTESATNSFTVRLVLPRPNQVLG